MGKRKKQNSIHLGHGIDIQHLGCTAEMLKDFLSISLPFVGLKEPSNKRGGQDLALWNINTIGGSAAHLGYSSQRKGRGVSWSHHQDASGWLRGEDCRIRAICGGPDSMHLLRGIPLAGPTAGGFCTPVTQPDLTYDSRVRYNAHFVRTTEWGIDVDGGIVLRRFTAFIIEVGNCYKSGRRGRPKVRRRIRVRRRKYIGTNGRLQMERCSGSPTLKSSLWRFSK